jgi:phosphate acetyltransferase
MKHAFFLAPAGRGQGLTTVALGVVEALDRRGVRVAFYKPIDEGIEQNPEPDRSTHFLRAITPLAPVDPLPLAHVAKLISDGRLDEVMGEVIGSYQNSTKGADMVVVEGLSPSPDDSYRGVLNQELVNALNGEVISQDYHCSASQPTATRQQRSSINSAPKCQSTTWRECKPQ